MCLVPPKKSLENRIFARENQVGGSQLRSGSWGWHAALFALKYRGNAIGKEAFNSEGLLSQARRRLRNSPGWVS